MAQKAVGIRDVAREAGVSVTTVSHILNDVESARASVETRERVRATAARLGYGANRIARSLRRQRTEMIGLISEEIATTPHAGRIILGAQEAAHAHGLTLVLINTVRESSDLSADIDTLLRQQVDGILFATMFHREVSLPHPPSVPTVLIDARDLGGLIPSAVPDEVGGARAAVSELVDAGHRRIGFLTNREDVPATRLRLQAYREILTEAGIPIDESLIVEELSESPGGYRAGKLLLERADRPTALFCYNDRMAMGAYRAAAELHLEIPRDLSVVGFDNQEIIAEGLYPPLTTVALPHYEMGAWAVDTLVGLLAGRGEELLLASHPVLLPCPLVRRDSVQAPPAP
ncbi:LacI family DNA-binding transcriptional regulator [Rathayibacter sp. VKM Ac-2803]|uniref:LacI family DNA-binding transcriptional regulator n=1 Tax=unclassified Rathayibacter TaxID=2609250 RepID=UPI001356FA03|nr:MULTISPECIES: LacI family DNA-binding transcriptional regulator [unclassified Rathayibacter]MWV48648.1 LacI family DNA-binding transcriptional regulator [Rathayibacter sp. VKM Ac-2803]MWV60677.1 LacI family DNA-binding transcriptional regulator [Rathayibacter sp. VKM Ac-2754]